VGKIIAEMGVEHRCSVLLKKSEEWWARLESMNALMAVLQ